MRVWTVIADVIYPDGSKDPHLAIVAANSERGARQIAIRELGAVFDARFLSATEVTDTGVILTTRVGYARRRR